jgi:CheY-like chemotaxis protein
VGDSLRIYQILHNVLSYTLEDKNAKRSRIVLSIETRSNNKLVFKIVNVGQYLNQERMDSLFIPNSWEEIQHTNKKFSFFVTNELASQMDGLFEIHSDIEHGTSYELILPYIEDEEQKSNKEQLEKILPDTKALIVYDDNMFNMEILKNNLESFGVSIDHQTTHHLKSHKFDMGHWDIAIISTQDITPLYLEFFQRLREKRGTKVVLLHEIYESEDLVDVALQITDAEIYSPVIPGDIEETLLTILSDKKKMKQRSSREEHFLDSYNQKGIINIVESPNVSREDFRKFSGNHILVAEDNFVNQKVIGSILSASGIHVHKAENGVRAIEILKEHKIDLVLMDMSMPVMDGFTATRKIKEDPDLTGIPIVAVSALGFKHEIERMEQVGVDACVVKPFKIGQIFIALDKYLSVIETSVVEHDAIDYSPDKDILDVEQGILNTHNKVFYKEILREVRSLLGNSEVHFVQMVLGMEEKELKVFCRDTLSLVETIGATQLTKILREILVFLSGKKRVSLERYVPLYRKEWKLLNAEIEKYIKR